MMDKSWEITVVGVEDALDLDSVSHVKERLRSVLERSGPVVLDLRSAVLDSTGLGAVLSLQRRLDLQDRLLLVVSDDARFHRLLDITGVRAALRVVRSFDEAVGLAREQVLVPTA